MGLENLVIRPLYERDLDRADRIFRIAYVLDDWR